MSTQLINYHKMNYIGHSLIFNNKIFNNSITKQVTLQYLYELYNDNECNIYSLKILECDSC